LKLLFSGAGHLYRPHLYPRGYRKSLAG